MKIQNVTDSSFRKYGKVLEGYDFSGLLKEMKHMPVPELSLIHISPEEGSDFCHRLVFHGRDVCTARTKPHCDKCCLFDICKKII